jgi:superfamily II DNA or RNA helicase
MPLSTELSSDFTGTIRSRGADYFRGGSVRIRQGDPWMVDAVVRGGLKYEVRLWREEEEIHVRCTCPYYETDGPCKHIWATILASDEKGYLKGDGKKTPLVLVREYDDEDDDYDDYDDDYDDEDEREEPQSVLSNVLQMLTPPPGQKKKTLSWKEQLAALGRAATAVVTGGRDQWPASRRLIYVVDIPSTLGSQYVILDTLVQDRKQDGEWGRPRKQRIPRHLISEFPDPLDRQIFAMLAGSREQMEHSYFGYNYQDAYDTAPSRYRLSAPLPQIVLPLIARSGRCFLKSSPHSDEIASVSWNEGEPWRFSVQVRRGEMLPEQYEVKGVLRRGEEELDFVKPAMMLQGGLVFTSEQIAPLDDGDAFNWVSILRRIGTLLIPENQIGEFLTEVLGEAQPPRLDLPEELQYETVTATPRPCLIVKAQTRGTRLRGRVRFDYAAGAKGAMLDGDDPRGGVFDIEQRRYLLRDKAAEAAAASKLGELGLKQAPTTYSDPKPGWDIAPTKLPRIVRELIAGGWHVEAEGKTFRNPGEIKMQVSSGIDWFELHGSVDFGGTTAKLPELLAALKRGDNMVKLDDGTYGMLPEEWLKKYGAIAGLGEAHDDHLRFRKTQVGVLDALLAAQPEADFDETFQKARDRLKQFEGVKTAEPPAGFIGELRPYQKDGLGWIHFLREFGFGGCLADDMGLGKTIQVLALLEARRQAREQNGSNGAKHAPSLAIVPKSLVFNWKAEAERFTPKLRILDHTGQFRDKEGETFEGYDLILTTYGTLRNDAVVFKDLQFDYIILDEAQAIKNADTASAKATRLLRGDHRLALSGTPVENHLGELWSLFEFLNPGMLGAASVFKLAGNAARNPDEATRKMLAHALRPFILRRTKDQVAKDLPPKQEQTIFCELEPQQRKLYNELRDHYRASLLKRIDAEGIAKSKMHVLEALLRLRQAACHPGLIDKARVAESSAKLDLLVPRLSELFEEGHKVLVFSQFTSLLSIVKSRLDAEKIPYEYLDGKTRDRQARVDTFQNDPACKLFLISLKAGGLGLNLTAAEYVYLLDPWWNPAVEAQAIDRAHRIGQTQQVFAYRLIARDTVEEKVLALQNTKRDLADAIINADNSLIRNLGREDLELLLS